MLLLVIFPLMVDAGLLADLKDTLKQELQKNINKINEDLQRTINQADNTANTLVKVPLLMGKTPAQAENILREYGLTIGKVIYRNSEKTVGTIISQNPAENTQVKKNTAISVVVAQQANNSRLIVVPKLIGLSVNEARTRLKQHLLTLGKITEQISDKAKGNIIAQSPKAKQKVAKNSPVNIVIAKHPSTKPVVSLQLSKNPIKAGEAVSLSATIKPKPTAELQYSFTINGKVYESQNGRLLHRFQQAGKLIITANIRPKGRKWIHSKSQALLVKPAELPPRNTSSETSIKVPNVVGLSLNNAIEQLKQAGLAIGHISQQMTAGASKVLQQHPKAGTSVKLGQKIDLVNAINNKINLNLSVSTTDIDVYEPIEFHAELVSNTEIKPRKYTLIIDKQRIDSSSPVWSYRFNKAGQYQAQAEVDIADFDIIQSQAITINVSSKWIEPKAIIEPATLIVQQGDKASFVSQSTHDPNSKLSLLWMDEKGGSGKASQYIINTEGWDIGDYWVTLRVKDDRGFEHTDKAELIISNTLVDTSEKTNPPETEKANSDSPNGHQLSLSASTYYAVIGEPINFTITQQAARGTVYTVVYGDGKTEETSQLWLTHSYKNIGRYFAYVISHYQGKQIQSKKIKLWILPSWRLIGIFSILFILFTLLGIFKLLKSKVKHEGKSKKSIIRYEPIIDQGKQQLKCKTNSHDISATIQLVGVKDKGQQRILRKSSERNE